MVMPPVNRRSLFTRGPHLVVARKREMQANRIPASRVVPYSFGSLDRNNTVIRVVVAAASGVENLSGLPCVLLYRRTSVAQEIDARGAAERCVRDASKYTPAPMRQYAPAAWVKVLHILYGMEQKTAGFPGLTKRELVRACLLGSAIISPNLSLEVDLTGHLPRSRMARF